MTTYVPYLYLLRIADNWVEMCLCLSRAEYCYHARTASNALIENWSGECLSQNFPLLYLPVIFVAPLMEIERDRSNPGRRSQQRVEYDLIFKGIPGINDYEYIPFVNTVKKETTNLALANVDSAGMKKKITVGSSWTETVRHRCEHCFVVRVGGGYMILGHGTTCLYCGLNIDMDIGEFDVSENDIQDIQDILDVNVEVDCASDRKNGTELDSTSVLLREHLVQIKAQNIHLDQPLPKIRSASHCRNLLDQFNVYCKKERAVLLKERNRILCLKNTEGTSVTRLNCAWKALERAEKNYRKQLEAAISSKPANGQFRSA